MNKMISLIAMLLSVVPASADLTLTLSVEPRAALPGIPPTLRVIAKNGGNASAAMPATVALRVVPPDGQPFLAFASPRTGSVAARFSHAADLVLTLASGEQRELTFWSSPENPPWFHADAQLFQPGTYTLQLIADDTLRRSSGSDVAPVSVTPTVTSNSVTFTVQTPTGEDAAVYQLLKELPDKAFWPVALANTIWSTYPNSGYTQWAVPELGASMTAEEKIAVLQAAIGKNPSSTIANWYRYTLAYVETNRCHQLTDQGKIDLAVDASDEARKLLNEVLKSSSDPDLRGKAEQLLSFGVRTRDQIIAAHSLVTGHPVEEITAEVDCGEDLADGSRRIYFGYRNLTAHDWLLPVGENNKITPPPFDQGQPTRFLTGGVHDLAFSIVTSKPEITWHLDKTNLVVKVRDVPKCTQ